MEMQRTISKRHARTITSADFRLGRLAAIFDVDQENMQLFVNLPAAHELQSLEDTGFENDFHVRLQLLPNVSAGRIERSLFAADTPPTSKYLKHTQRHRATPNPAIEEEFAFDLANVAANAGDFGLYIAVMATAPVASDDTGFAGCVGFPLDLVLSRGNKLPRWYWLYNKRTGLTTCEPVEHAVIDVPRGLMPDDMPDVVVAGRRRNLPNALINGVYVCRSERYGGRALYKQPERGLFLYYHPQRGAWAIGDTPGHAAPYAFVDDTASEPGKIKGVWQVFSREREFMTPVVKRGMSLRGGRPGVFEHDLQVTCRVHNDAAAPVERAQPPPWTVPPTFQPLFMQMQLNPELSHRHEPEPERSSHAAPRGNPPPFAPSERSHGPRLPSSLPPYMFPPMDPIDEDYE